MERDGKDVKNEKAAGLVMLCNSNLRVCVLVHKILLSPNAQHGIHNAGFPRLVKTDR